MPSPARAQVPGSAVPHAGSRGSLSLRTTRCSNTRCQCACDRISRSEKNQEINERAALGRCCKAEGEGREAAARLRQRLQPVPIHGRHGLEFEKLTLDEFCAQALLASSSQFLIVAYK